jgi:hypothetical protein
MEFARNKYSKNEEKRSERKMTEEITKTMQETKN